jgi:hypothetical protein
LHFASITTMYGGLFGDLPAAKNDGKNNNNSKDDSSKSTVVETNGAKVPEARDNTAIPQQRMELPVTKTVAAAPAMRPRFIPLQASRPRSSQPRPPQPAPKLKTPVVVSVAATTSAVGETTSQQQSGSTETSQKTPYTRDNGAEVNDTGASETKPPPPLYTSQVVPHAHHVALITANTDHDGSETKETPALTDVRRTTFETSHYTDGASIQKETAMSPVADDEDLYDPLVPNDLLQYWQHQALVRERRQLEQQRLETMRHQAELSRQLHQERHESRSFPGDAAAPAPPHGMLERAQHSGRGRGGLSNLPAWLVQKQKLQQSMSEPNLPGESVEQPKLL